MQIGTKRGEKGNAILEFALIGSFLIPLLLGAFTLGLFFARAHQNAQVCRDAAHMFSDNIDFSQPSNQTIVGRLAAGMGLAKDSIGTIDPNGQGVVILSQIIHVGLNECLAGGFTSSTGCPNYDQHVFMKRIVIGNATLRSSAFGTPSASIVQPDGRIKPSDYTRSGSALVNSAVVLNDLNLARGQYTYATETYFAMPEMAAFAKSLSSTAGLKGTGTYNLF